MRPSLGSPVVPKAAVAATIADGSGDMFNAIARRYDFLNRVLSLGLDGRWRRATVEALQLRSGTRVLDVATGTGDLALTILDYCPDARVVGLDPSSEMLSLADAKADRAGHPDLELEEGDARDLPFADASFDAVTIAFGIRNVPDRELGLREMKRVVKPGGRIAILELGEPEKGLLGFCARFYIRWIVPVVGAVLSGRKEYRYLQRSIAAFPPTKEFCSMLESAGLGVLEVRPLMFGVCNLFVAQRSPDSAIGSRSVGPVSPAGGA